MKKIAITIFVGLLFLAVGCAKTSYFGVPSKSIFVPKDFAQTEAAIQDAAGSIGAMYCPEKITEAEKLAKEGIEIYWTCRDQEAFDLLAQARALAQEAKSCKKTAAPAPAIETQPPQQAQVVEPEPAPEPTVTKPSIILEGVNFAFDSAELTQASYAVLDRQAVTLEANPDLEIEVAGHTCSIGTEAYNQQLSERRAQSVVKYLVSKGISPDQLHMVGYGELHPKFSNDTKEGRSKNRRVELKIR